MKFNDIVNKILNEDASEELEKGIKVEKEHTDIYNELKKMFGDELPWSLEEFSGMIAKDHIKENPKYYEYLKDMEKKMDSESKLKNPVKEAMTSGGTGGVFTAYSGTVDAGAWGGHVGNIPSNAPNAPGGPGDARNIYPSSMTKSTKNNKKNKKNKKKQVLMPVSRRMFPNVK